MIVAVMKSLTLLYVLLLAPLAQASDARLRINDAVFQIELAVTPAEQRRGLMHRPTLPEGQGMLFVYPEPRMLSFWMKQTLIPLDILFFDHGGRLLQLYDNVPPCKQRNCPTYSNETPAQYVLELPGGSAKRHSISIGNQFELLSD